MCHDAGPLLSEREYARPVRGLTGEALGTGCGGLRLEKGGQWGEGELRSGCETDGLQLTAIDSAGNLWWEYRTPEAVKVEKIGPPMGHASMALDGMARPWVRAKRGKRGMGGALFTTSHLHYPFPAEPLSRICSSAAAAAVFVVVVLGRGIDRILSLSASICLLFLCTPPRSPPLPSKASGLCH